MGGFRSATSWLRFVARRVIAEANRLRVIDTQLEGRGGGGGKKQRGAGQTEEHSYTKTAEGAIALQRDTELRMPAVRAALGGPIAPHSGKQQKAAA